ncbi:DNA topology modulation protein [Paenisporosarcina cavernae]|uniref:DNA topology modulation protein n=1 Tax=Paenisporosarcina cavernae TaxID=2320858 RepID=A0A385YVC0_9BACL|nr:DNA topology modulation protein [Paenisporosarcina cavernae]AYC30845.1 DNA topology modulation protein [Paenisporosarcina cavernae]
MQHNPKKILIVGSSGAGKSTLAKELSVKWNVPVIHLDVIYWQPGWVALPKKEFIAQLEKTLQNPEWIIDGNFDSTLEYRLQYADTIIYLDYSKYVCLYRAFKRVWKYRGKTRPDMGKECPEKMDIEFFQWIWRFPKDIRPKMMSRLAKSNATVYMFLSPKETKNWLQTQRKATE